MALILLTLSLGFAPPAPPIVATPTPVSAPALLAFEPGAARCSGSLERPIFSDLPLPVALDHPRPDIGAGEVRLRFRVARDGRPLGIDRLEGTAGLPLLGSDIAPALASWRFAPGAERRDCEIAFSARLWPVGQAPLPILHRAMVLSRPSRRFREAAWRRVHPKSSTCTSPPVPRTMQYPALEQIEQPPGTAAYSLVGFDVDAAGRPANVSILSSSGNEELDRRSLAAIEASRYRPEAKQGCSYPYWRRNTDPLAAPPPPEPEAFRPAGSTCGDTEDEWQDVPPLRFPESYRRRQIEGWAIIGYDRAPWGATGNVKVLAADPAVDFGERAIGIVRAARAHETDSGATGCVTRVIFRMERDDDPPPPE